VNSKALGVSEFTYIIGIRKGSKSYHGNRI